MQDDYLANVRQQYERYPYPPRDPEEERQRLLEVQIERLALINFYCFQGKHTFDGARVLVAGGGTGDSTIYLAEQLLKKKGEVVYVDVSQASLAIARERAAIRKLDNIRFVHASLLSLTTSEVGTFDYVSCTGVLHHLDDPLAGLRALKAVLKPNGGMGILLYAKYGRTGVYQLQDLMQLVNTHETDLGEKIVNTRKVLAALPESNWFRMSEKYLSGDHKRLGDSGLVDLLLHEQDVAYSVDEVHDLIGKAGLNVVEFCDVKMRMAYRPQMFIRDQALLQHLSKLDRITQLRIGELMGGVHSKHVLYVSSQQESVATLGDMTDVPFFFPPRLYRDMGPQLAEAMRRNPTAQIPIRHEAGFELTMRSQPTLAAILNNIDGARSWREVFAGARTELGSIVRSDEELLEFFRPVYEQLRQFDWMLLRGAAVDEYAETPDLQAESEDR